MVDTNFTGDDYLQSFATSIKHNNNATSKIFRVPLRSYLMQFEHDITHKMTSQRLPPSGEEYRFFHNCGKTDQATQFAKSRSLTKVIESIL